MAYSYVRYSGNGSTTNYTFSFPTISTDHIKVRVNGTLVTNWSFLSASTIQFATAPANAAVIEIRRETPKESSIVNFTDGSVLLERDLDLLATWELYVAQETEDDLEDTIRADSQGRFDALNKRIINVADPINAQDAVTKTWAETGMSSQLAQATSQATAAAGSATAAAGSASAAATSAGNASTSASNAAGSATDAANSATAASGSATAAANSATAASTSATNANSSAVAAAASATSASGSATTATTQATNAAASAVSAANSAAAAATALDNFDDRYLGQKDSDPSVDNDGNALITGALYYNTTDSAMRVYTGTGWINASSAQVATMKTFVYVATAAQTTFTGNDANGSSLTYVAPYLVVSLNGLELRPIVDYTATNGTSVVLTSAAAAGDELQVLAFSSFNVVNIQAANVTHSQGGSGAVPRSVDTKLKELVSITDFGASPTASAAVNTAAITAALAASKSVMVPEGTFNFTGFTIPSGRTLFGASRDGSILQSTDATAIAIVNVTGVVVENLTIISTGTVYGNTVYVGNGASQVTVQNCVIVSAYRPFMAGDPGDAAGCTYVRFLNNRTYTTSSDGGLRTRKGANGTGGVIWFVGNIIINNNATSEDVGIETWTPDTTIVDNVIVASNLKGGFSGITFGVGEGGIAKGNRISGFSAGIEIGGSGKGLHIIDGNQIVNCKEGILVSTGGGEEAVTLINNVIVMDAVNRSDYLYAFYIQCKAAIISNNTAYYHNAGTTYLNTTSRKAKAIYGDTNNKQMLVSGNVFKNFDIGVQLAATSPDVQIVGNDFYNVYSPVYDSGGTPQTFFANNNVSEFAFFNINGYCNFTDNVIRRSANYPVGANASLSTTPYAQSLSTAYLINENNRFVNVAPSAFGFNAEYYVTAAARPAVERVNGTYKVANLSDPAAAKTALTNVGISPNGKFIEEWYTANIYEVGQNGAVQTFGTAAPTSGTWSRGDKVWNSTPSASGTPGWVCTAGGTPGTWKAMANLAA